VRPVGYLKRYFTEFQGELYVGLSVDYTPSTAHKKADGRQTVAMCSAVCVCVCVCMHVREHTHTHTHTH